MVDLGRVALAALDVVAPTAAAKGVQLRTDIVEGASMMGDPDRLQQIVWNLLANAIKFTPGGGRVTVGVTSNAGTLSLTVTDTGEGIPETFLPQLFERFRQADPSASRRHGGPGIGLSLVRQLVELHGGRIIARSTEGEGSTFMVTFPALGERVEPAEVNDDVPASLEDVRVLVIDHEEDGRALLVVALEQHGAAVTAVARAADALDVVRRAHLRPHVIVVDVRPSDDAGVEVVEVLQHSSGPGGPIPAIAVLAHDQASERERVKAAGFHAHLSKPLSPSALAFAVRNVAGLPDPGYAGTREFLDGLLGAR